VLRSLAMNTDRPISELVDLLERSQASADPSQLLRDIQEELEHLIQRHHLEVSLRTDESR